VSRFGGAPLVIGCGNELRGDDAVGLWVARRLQQRGGFQVIGDREPR
jgi:Ni,Fe-hydrogenase maturation factor